MIDNSGVINYEQLYAQVIYELKVLKAPYWFNNDQVKRIQELNLDYMTKKDLTEMIAVCFRKPNNGEAAKSLIITNNGENVKLIDFGLVTYLSLLTLKTNL